VGQDLLLNEASNSFGSGSSKFLLILIIPRMVPGRRPANYTFRPVGNQTGDRFLRRRDDNFQVLWKWLSSLCQPLRILNSHFTILKVAIHCAQMVW
jgi:hypothetical protein